MVVRRIAFATSNADKLREVRAIFRRYGVSVLWDRRRLPEPQADSLREVVRAKLAAVPSRALPGVPVLVEDSGIFLSGLRGFPGVYSRFVYDSIGLGGVLRLLEGQERTASFRTAAGIRIGRTEWITEGRVEGTIASAPRGTAGFGYDPIFVPRGGRRTFGELSSEEKERFSHRGRAIRSVARYLSHL